jgi:two-component system, chemotaxis family, protein-glutamate methylesterase/glutaminase
VGLLETHHPQDAASARPPAAFGAVAIAASAGGVQALREVVNGLPNDFGAAVLVLQHLAQGYRSHLAEILARRSAMPVRQATQGGRLRPGAIVVAPPGAHLVVGPGGRLMLEASPRLHHLRPAADRLFGSLAASFGARAAAVVLTGTGRDGARGVTEVKRKGGRVIVQDEATSEYFGMPRAAIGTGDVDHVLPLTEIAGCLVEIVAGWR